MPRNIGSIDQVIRAVLGLAAVVYVLGGGPYVGSTVLIGLLGIYLFVTAFFLYCPLYGVFGLSTVERLDRST
jgi:hypothetical protein